MKTQQYILIGHPVSHSISPQIHSAVYQQMGLPHQYVAVDCPDEAAVAAQIGRLRRGEIAGANVTVPWKRVALALADELDESASRTQAANVLHRTADGRIRAYNTDQGALARLLLEGSNGVVRQVTILGNGGAALAAAVAAQRAGATQIVVSARRWQGAEPWPDRQEFGGLGVITLPWGSHEFGEALVGADVIVQATSAGMKGVGFGETVTRVIPWEKLKPSVFLYDVVYNPPLTPFLDQAQRSGHRAEGGLSMLLGQAALAMNIWLGIDAPLGAMRAAAERALFGTPQGRP
jgi:shikimate dehydrogenase